ncbi:hypothetical protein L596_000287 [Steinernema carpocapsae]|uniref:Uncharacterized protein n=1 Tax=Steinernema carpocapsae TaxID=34508 RepID=A0A4U8UHW5_STECR|nr:hypothetical protein L596_000287 [Steinernema carpocapsae]
MHRGTTLGLRLCVRVCYSKSDLTTANRSFLKHSDTAAGWPDAARRRFIKLHSLWRTKLIEYRLETTHHPDLSPRLLLRLSLFRRVQELPEHLLGL